MNKIEDNKLYASLDKKTKAIVDTIKRDTSTITKSSYIEVIDEFFEENSNLEDWWYSYVRVVNCVASNTLSLNEQYVDKLINKNYLDDINAKIIFRFESGVTNGI